MRKVLMYLGLVCLVLIMGCNGCETADNQEASAALNVAKTKLTIVARIQAKEGKAEFVKKELLKLIDITKAEEGCIDYELHQDNKDPNLFLFYENWENRELWQKHIKNAHVENFGKVTKEAVQKVTINEMTILKY